MFSPLRKMLTNGRSSPVSWHRLNLKPGNCLSSASITSRMVAPAVVTVARLPVLVSSAAGSITVTVDCVVECMATSLHERAFQSAHVVHCTYLVAHPTTCRD